jgi:hypothetical protein
MFLLVCEYASMSPAGEVSVVRGGLDRFTAEGAPLKANATLLAGTLPEELELGEHSLTFSLTRDSDGSQVVRGAGQVLIREPQLPGIFIIPFEFTSSDPGRLTLTVDIGGKLQGKLPLTVDIVARKSG